jgi:hypothetical protein
MEIKGGAIYPSFRADLADRDIIKGLFFQQRKESLIKFDGGIKILAFRFIQVNASFFVSLSRVIIVH